MPENKEFELRSEEVQDILTKVPHWMIRWGTILIFGIIIMLFFTSWFLKYPDVVKTDIVITTNIPPEKLVAKNSGRIEAILVKDKSLIIKFHYVVVYFPSPLLSLKPSGTEKRREGKFR